MRLVKRQTYDSREILLLRIAETEKKVAFALAIILAILGIILW